MIETKSVLDVLKQTQELKDEIYVYSAKGPYPAGNNSFFWFDLSNEEQWQQETPLLLQYYKDSGLAVPLLILVNW